MIPKIDKKSKHIDNSDAYDISWLSIKPKVEEISYKYIDKDNGIYKIIKKLKIDTIGDIVHLETMEDGKSNVHIENLYYQGEQTLHRLKLIKFCLEWILKNVPSSVSCIFVSGSIRGNVNRAYDKWVVARNNKDDLRIDLILDGYIVASKCFIYGYIERSLNRSIMSTGMSYEIFNKYLDVINWLIMDTMINKETIKVLRDRLKTLRELQDKKGLNPSLVVQIEDLVVQISDLENKQIDNVNIKIEDDLG